MRIICQAVNSHEMTTYFLWQIKIKMLIYNTPLLSCCGQITLSNIDKICPLAIPNQISLISMHVPSLVKIPWHLLSYRPETKIWVCLGQRTTSKLDEICPLAIPNQISTISMHILSLVKIHYCVVGYKNLNVVCCSCDWCFKGKTQNLEVIKLNNHSSTGDTF